VFCPAGNHDLRRLVRQAVIPLEFLGNGLLEVGYTCGGSIFGKTRVNRGYSGSDISGSKRVCRSPELIAACYVLHRLLMPRHPPCALLSLTKILVYPPPSRRSRAGPSED